MTSRYDRYAQIQLDRPHPRVLRITMNKPEQLNAIDQATHAELAADLARRRCRPGHRGGHHDRRRAGVLRRRRSRHGERSRRRLRRACPRLEGGARPRLQHRQLLQADRQRHARAGGRRRPRRRAAGRHLDRHQDGAPHRRPHPARRRRRRPCGDHLAAAVRHGQGQILPPALRAADRRGGRAHRPRLARGRRRRARRQGARDRRCGSPKARRARSAGPNTP